MAIVLNTLFSKKKASQRDTKDTVTFQHSTVVPPLSGEHHLSENQYRLALILNMNFEHPQRCESTIVFDDEKLEKFYCENVQTSDRINLHGYRDESNVLHVTELEKVWGF